MTEPDTDDTDEPEEQDVPQDAVARVDIETLSGGAARQYLTPGDEVSVTHDDPSAVTVKALELAEQPSDPRGRTPETGSKTGDVLQALVDADGWTTAEDISGDVRWAKGYAGEVHSYLSVLRQRGHVQRRKVSGGLNQYRLTDDGQDAIDQDWGDADA